VSDLDPFGPDWLKQRQLEDDVVVARGGRGDMFVPQSLAEYPSVAPYPDQAAAAAAAFRLLAVVACDGDAAMTWPAGWTALTNGAGASGTAVRSEARYRIATGSEGASITVTGGSEAWVSRTWRITGHLGTAPECAAATGTSADATPPYLGSEAYAKDTLWIIHLAWDNRPAFTFWPTSYGSDRLAAHVNDSGEASGWVQQASAATHAMRGIAPGPVTSVSAAWRALTIAVQPLVSKDAEEAAAKIAQRQAEYGVEP
jgi:hypothetical protein